MTVTKRTWFLETGFGHTQLVHDPANDDPATVGDKFGFVVSVISLSLWTIFRTLIGLIVGVAISFRLSDHPNEWWQWIFLICAFILFFRSLHPVKIGSDRFGLTTTEDK